MDKRVKLCFILSHLPQGGAERQTVNLIKGLSPSNYDITLLLYANTVIFYKEILELPISLIVNQNSRACRIFRNLKNALFLWKVLRKNDFDILHTLLYHNGFWVRVLAPPKYKDRILYSIRNTISDIPVMERLAEKLLVKKSIVVTNSKKAMRQYIKIVGEKHGSRVTNIYNGIEIERFLSYDPPQITDKIIIGTVGRQTSLKNQLQILQAIRNISKTNPLHFYLIGDKTQGGSVDNEKFVGGNELNEIVTILDSQSDIENFYRKFNVFVLSSITESCPNVLFEAMLSKCLCIVSEGANADKFVRDGINGFVYDGSLSMLEARLIQAFELIRNGNHYRIVENGMNFALKNFSGESMIMSYKWIYEKMLYA